MAANLSPRPGSPDSPTASAPLAPVSSAPRAGVVVAWPHVALAACGLAASAWAIHVHLLIKAGEETGCGISETISCDKVIGSQYGQVFGIPLGAYGVLFWALVFITAISSRGASMRAAALQRLLLASVGLASSVVLAYISLGVLKHFCPVCATTHVLSGINFLVALGLWWRGRGAAA